MLVGNRIGRRFRPIWGCSGGSGLTRKYELQWPPEAATEFKAVLRSPCLGWFDELFGAVARPLHQYSMLRRSVSEPEIGLPGRISAGF